MSVHILRGTITFRRRHTLGDAAKNSIEGMNIMPKKNNQNFSIFSIEFLTHSLRDR